jgi:predicted metal-dependent HD superfamily phosphohydrolase
MNDALLENCPAGLLLPPELVDAVRRAYASPRRAYHDIHHVEEVIRRFVEVARDVGWQRPREVYLALLFHDAVYVPGSTDNETRSAELARDLVARYLPDPTLDRDRIAQLILLTVAHGKLSPSDVDPEAALFLDCDMAILGSDVEAFEAYDAAIAVEYADIARADYLAGRGAFLGRLLARERIFLSEYGHSRWETAARRNVEGARARCAQAEMW